MSITKNSKMSKRLPVRSDDTASKQAHIGLRMALNVCHAKTLIFCFMTLLISSITGKPDYVVAKFFHIMHIENDTSPWRTALLL